MAADKTISSSQQALEHFLDDRFVIDEIAFRSQFRIDRELEAEPSDLATVNWGLEHIERLRRGRARDPAERGGADHGHRRRRDRSHGRTDGAHGHDPLSGPPGRHGSLTIDHQTRLDGYGALGKAVAAAGRAAKAGDGEAVNAALSELASAAATLSLLVDRRTRSGAA